MPLSFELTFADKTSGQTHIASGEFSDTEADILNRYVDACDRLANSRWIREGMWSTLHVSMRTPNEVRTTATLPDWDDVIVVLHKYRLIGLQNEPTFFGRVANILGKKIRVPYFSSDPRRAAYEVLRQRLPVSDSDHLEWQACEYRGGTERVVECVRVPSG